jgi:hypothetical protein
MQAPAVVTADKFQFDLSCYLQLNIFNWAFVTGRRAMNLLPLQILKVVSGYCKKPHASQLIISIKDYKKEIYE